jgi:hypothetical protein
VIGLTVCVLTGCTSSEKGTFGNVLLGQSIHPTAHTAATRIQCQITYEEKKQASIHFHYSDQPIVTWNPQNEKQRKRFEHQEKDTAELNSSKANGSSAVNAPNWKDYCLLIS